MSRRHRAERRELLPDPKFGSLTVSRFMNSVMKQGKKSVAEKIVYGALDQIEGKIKQSPVAVFEQALGNVAPAIEVRSRRVGGATYQVPVEVRPERRTTLAIRWIIDAARELRAGLLEPWIHPHLPVADLLQPVQPDIAHSRRAGVLGQVGGDARHRLDGHTHGLLVRQPVRLTRVGEGLGHEGHEGGTAAHERHGGLDERRPAAFPGPSRVGG